MFLSFEICITVPHFVFPTYEFTVVHIWIQQLLNSEKEEEEEKWHPTTFVNRYFMRNFIVTMLVVHSFTTLALFQT